jgi:hypothetical protein
MGGPQRSQQWCAPARPSGLHFSLTKGHVLRFVSKSQRLHAGNYRNAELAMSEAKVVVIDGKSRAVQPEPYTVSEPVPIQFGPEGLMQSDIDAALTHWKHFEGLGMEEDGVTPANPVENGRIGVWDSVVWQTKYRLADSDREAAEQMLLTSTSNGPDYFPVEEVKATIPWPSYGDTHHNKIAVLAAELGLVDAALAYERENKNRESVIASLEAQTPAETGEFVTA